MAWLTGLTEIFSWVKGDYVHLGRPSLGNPNDRRLLVDTLLATGATPGNVALNQVAIPKNISEAYTNLVLDPEDLTTANWTKSNVTITNSGVSIKGHPLSTVTLTGVAGQALQQTGIFDYSTDGQKVSNCIIRNGNNSTVEFGIFDNTGAAIKLRVVVNFAAGTVTASTGTVLDYTWLDDKTVEVYGLSTAITAASNNRWQILGDQSGDYFYCTACQSTDSNGQERFPFVTGAKTTDAIDKSFTMPGKGLHVWRGTPFFAYDTATNHVVFEWRVSGTQYLRAQYNQVTDTMRTTWYDGGTARSMDAGSFDDGTTLSVNQELLIMLYMEAESGGLNDSLLIVIPVESGAISSDNAWTGIPDVQSTDQPTLSLGHESGGLEANSECFSFRSYDWDGTLPTVPTSLEDADRLLAGLTPLFSATSSPTVDTDAITDETSLAVAVEKQAYTDQLMQDFDSWHIVGADNEPAFSNSWDNAGGTTPIPLKIKKHSDGSVEIIGKIDSGTVGTNVMSLDNGYFIPNALQQFSIVANGVFARCEINGRNFKVYDSNVAVYVHIRYYVGF